MYCDLPPRRNPLGFDVARDAQHHFPFEAVFCCSCDPGPGVIMKVRDETGGFLEPMGNVPRLLGWDEDWPFTLMIPDSFDNCGP